MKFIFRVSLLLINVPKLSFNLIIKGGTHFTVRRIGGLITDVNLQFISLYFYIRNPFVMSLTACRMV